MCQHSLVPRSLLLGMDYYIHLEYQCTDRQLTKYTDSRAPLPASAILGHPVQPADSYVRVVESLVYACWAHCTVTAKFPVPVSEHLSTTVLGIPFAHPTLLGCTLGTNGMPLSSKIQGCRQ